ncbi:MAG TPA: superoxide dismutase family protein [Planctomycetota bacterium]
MKRSFAILSALALVGCEREGNGEGPRMSKAAPAARAELVDTQGRPVGTARFAPDGRGLRVTLDLRGLPPGTHALHLHEKGVCDRPEFKSSGDHFNPTGRKHGLLNPEGPHAGDLPNILVAGDGTSRGSFHAPYLSLEPGPNSVFGTCLMIHAGPDDGMTDPAGNAGGRIACGALRKE